MSLQWKEFLLFACLLLGVCVIFSFMSYFYTYADPDQLDKMYLGDSVIEEDNEDDMKKKIKDIPLKEPGNGTKM